MKNISFALCQPYSVPLTVWALCINQYTQSDFINSPCGYNLTYACYPILPMTSEELRLWLMDCVQPVRRTNPTEPAQGGLLSIAIAFLSVLPSCTAQVHVYIPFSSVASRTEAVSAESVGGIHLSRATRMSHRVWSYKKTESNWIT